MFSLALSSMTNKGSIIISSCRESSVEWHTGDRGSPTLTRAILGIYSACSGSLYLTPLIFVYRIEWIFCERPHQPFYHSSAHSVAWFVMLAYPLVFESISVITIIFAVNPRAYFKLAAAVPFASNKLTVIIRFNQNTSAEDTVLEIIFQLKKMG